MAAQQVRRTQEQRSAKTQQKLAKAAFDLIRAEGYASFRVAAVAKAAGVSQGGQLHHFPNKHLMTMAAIEHAIAVADARSQRNLQSFRPGDDVVLAISEDLREYYFSASFEVAMDITKSAAGNPELRREIARAHRESRERVEALWRDVLLIEGWREADADDLITMTGNLVRGAAIRAMIRPDRKAYERMLQRWREMVATSFDQG